MSNLGLFVLQLAHGKEKTLKVPEQMAIEIHENLSNQIFNNIEKLRKEQKREEKSHLNFITF